jgi:hypothetical protein
MLYLLEASLSLLTLREGDKAWTPASKDHGVCLRVCAPSHVREYVSTAVRPKQLEGARPGKILGRAL